MKNKFYVSILFFNKIEKVIAVNTLFYDCLLYTSDAADERSSVDLGGRRIIKKKNTSDTARERSSEQLSRNATTHNNTCIKQPEQK